MPRVRIPALLGALALLLVAAVPAAAIQYGERDNGAHPYVAGWSSRSTATASSAAPAP